MEEELIVTGKVVSGAGQGAYFTRIDWVLRQCAEKLGFKPYPGTLNLEISEQFLAIVASLEREEGIEFISPDPKFCNARVFPVVIGEIAGAVILPEEKVRVHPKNIIEIIAPLNLKLTLNVKDGDSVTIALIHTQRGQRANGRTGSSDG
jgi:CTP-dependent riboflavin kinase